MEDKFLKTYLIADKIVNEVNDYTEKYTTIDGKNIPSEDSILLLNSIIEKGFSLHRYIVENELFKNEPEIAVTLIELQKIMLDLQNNEKNAKKLNINNAMQLWQQSKILIAALACNILDYMDKQNGIQE